MPVIDIHNHFFPRTWPDLAARFGTPDWPWIKHTEPGKAEIMVGDRFFRQSTRPAGIPKCACRKWIAMASTCRSFRPRRCCSPTTGRMNMRSTARECSTMPRSSYARGKGRLKSLCQVPLQDIDASCKEFSRCMRAGHLGVQIGNHVGDKNLDDPGIVTFLRHCADEGARYSCIPGTCWLRRGCRST